ncbi:hypothetical protein [Actinoallomurus vinaceus]|uniref:hypothetical protein n=1 Tax=Actinoallomurus vinaceus TaxID=1080074 RepID=UPI0031E6DD91
MAFRIEQPGDREAVRDLHLRAFGGPGKVGTWLRSGADGDVASAVDHALDLVHRT